MVFIIVDTKSIFFVIEIIGTIAFASSGAMVALQKNMDIFGVNVMGIVTATGGGMIRDIMIGKAPPTVFFHVFYVGTAVVASTLLFTLIFIRKELFSECFRVPYEKVMIFFDAVGLGAFTVLGSNKAIEAGFEDHALLLVFVGVITGVGGGVLRDVFAGTVPVVFVKHIYASASIGGAVIYLLLRGYVDNSIAMIISAVLIVVIRMLAARFRWNLPRIYPKK